MNEELKLAIESAREQIQNDLDCILDGIPDYDRIFNNACQAVVDRFASSATDQGVTMRKNLDVIVLVSLSLIYFAICVFAR